MVAEALTERDASERDGVVWCAACGIPYAPTTPYCDSCHQPLQVGPGGELSAALAVLADDADSDATDTRSIVDSSDLAPALVISPVAEVAVAQPLRQRGVLGRRFARRPRPLTEDEIETRAAAIVAQARAEELAGIDEPFELDDEADMADDDEDEPVAYVDFLPPLRQRDRQWLGAGLVCCVVLIVFAAFFVRFLAG